MTDHSELKTVEMNCDKDRPGAQNALLVQDLSFRDGQQALFRGCGRTEDMVRVAERMDAVGFWAVEVWGGETFETMHRCLGENPWERLRTLKRYFKKTPLSMLLRGQHLVGDQPFADDVVRLFVKKASENGIDVFRLSDGLNDFRNFETAVSEIKKAGGHFQGCISYALTEPRLGGDLYNLTYYADKAGALADAGADSVCVEDTAGLLTPYDAYELVKALKNAVDIPVHLHSHFTTGMSSMVVLKAVEAGVDIVDACLAPFSYGDSHAAVEPLVAALMGTSRDTGFDLDALAEIDAVLEKEVMPKYRHLADESRAAVINVDALQHQVPGCVHADLVSQLEEMDAPDRVADVYAALPGVRKALGQIPMAAPAGQIIGKQSVNNVLFDADGDSFKMISAQVKDLCYGLYGKTPAAIDSGIQARALKGYEKGENPLTGRPGDKIEPALDAAGKEIGDLAVDDEDLLLYALFPVSGKKYLMQKYGKAQMPESFAPVTLEDVQKQNVMIDRIRKGEPADPKNGEVPEKSENLRTFNVYVEGEYFEVDVDEVGGVPVVQYAAPAPAPAPVPAAPPAPAVPSAPAAPAAAPPVPKMATPKPAAPKAPAPKPAAPKPAAPAGGGGNAVSAPMPGVVIKYEKNVGDSVNAGDTVVIIEAMKMENALPAPCAGVIKAIHFSNGASVAKNDVLAEIE